MAYRNPILPGFHPDPSIVRVGEDYYLANSTFQWWPGITLHHSRDLVHWEPLGYALDRLELLNLHGVDDSMGLWAPTLRHFDGMFHLIVSLIRQIVPGAGNPLCVENLLFTAKDVRGPWSGPTYVNDAGIDPDLFRDDDGRFYVASNGAFNDEASGDRIVVQEFDMAARSVVGPRKLLWGGTELGVTEGPHLFRRNGWYYLLTAEGGTGYGHAVQLCRSRTLLGPYDLSPHSPLLTMAGRDQQFACSGHADLVETQNGEWWMVLLATRPTPDRHRILGRETCLLPCRWTDDGWLEVNEGRGIEAELPVPNLPASPEWSLAPDAVLGSELGPEWQAVRGFAPEHMRLEDGAISLRGRPHPLQDINAVNVVGRRQQHLRFDASVEVHFTAAETGDRAGLACYYDRLHWIFASLAWQDGPVIELTRRDGDNVETTTVPWPDGGSAVIGVEGDDEEYRFYARPVGSGDWQPVGDPQDGSHLSDDRAGVVRPWAAFTGTFLCLFATGPSTAYDRWAVFREFRYTGR